ncbi:MAG: polyphenol oxidase family protein, partial [Bacteriovoracaceae bacterium]|nr:polyphenol oxidase family protein [Bacteriovoracaceae bacterium]
NSVMPENSFLMLQQIHSTKLYLADDLAKLLTSSNQRPEGDGIYQPSLPHRACWVIKTADCMPVAFIGNHGCAFVHAGRRGLWDNILIAPEIKSLDPQFIFIGPHIKKCCYEVELALLKEAASFAGKVYYEDIPPKPDCCSPVLGGLPPPKIHLDLTATAIKQLAENFPQAKISVAQACTCCDKHLHSYRRDQNKERNFNLWRF